ncbi:MAG: hypothetical protein JKY42_10205 [Flavobacteriales bacterium]|nr:hypothetical protein [Flavobacteriales bacterium]
MKRFKRLTFFAVMLVAGWHTLATFVYVSDAKFNPAFLNRYVGAYMLPWFHQDWKLFAPEPPMMDLYMYYKVQFEDGSWSEWKNPARPLITEFQKNRFGTAGQRYAYQDILIRQLWDDCEKYENHEDYPEVLKTTWTNENVIKYYKKWAKQDYPNRKIVSLRFATLNLHFNELKNRNTQKKIELKCLFPIVDV